MAFSTNSIIDKEWYDALQDFSGKDNIIEYYIFTEKEEFGYDGRQVALSLAEVSHIRQAFRQLSNITGTSFIEAIDYEAAPLNVYSVSGYDDEDTEGSTSMEDDWFDITWKNYGGGLMTDSEMLTLVHEIAHAAGLDHPNGDGWEPGWDDSISVMSYYANEEFVPTTFRELDIRALQELFSTNPVESMVTNFVHGNIDGNDLKGTDRPDEIIGYAGNDNLQAYLGADTLLGLEGDDVIYGNQGQDTIKGGLGKDVVYGGQDVDQIYGNEAEDRLYGNKGDDLIYGGKSNDWLHGGQGDDVMYGNLGADVFNLSVGSDRVMDFDESEGDLISIRPGIGYVIKALGSDLLIESDIGSLLLLDRGLGSFNSTQSIVFE